jgi:hypothetical protein
LAPVKICCKLRGLGDIGSRKVCGIQTTRRFAASLVAVSRFEIASGFPIRGIGPIHLSPKGAQYDSPRQRPGNWDEISPSPEGAKQDVC